jgi:hypothetical protein
VPLGPYPPAPVRIAPDFVALEPEAFEPVAEAPDDPRGTNEPPDGAWANEWFTIASRLPAAPISASVAWKNTVRVGA